MPFHGFRAGLNSKTFQALGNSLSGLRQQPDGQPLLAGCGRQGRKARVWVREAAKRRHGPRFPLALALTAEGPQAPETEE